MKVRKGGSQNSFLEYYLYPLDWGKILGKGLQHIISLCENLCYWIFTLNTYSVFNQVWFSQYQCVQSGNKFPLWLW